MHADLEPNGGGGDQLRSRTRRLLKETTRAIQSSPDATERDTAKIVTQVVTTVAIADPEYAERLAGSIRDEIERAHALSSVAVAIAPIDAGYAERLVDGLATPAPQSTVAALVAVARALPKNDASRIKNVLKKAERTARAHRNSPSTVRDPHRAVPYLELAAIAEAWAELIDHGRARRLLSELVRAEQLNAAAKAMAAFDSRRGERIARSIPNTDWQIDMLIHIAVGWVADAPQEAERILASIRDKVDSVGHRLPKIHTVGKVVLAMAESDPGRAEKLARTVTEEFHLAPILVELGAAVAETDPARAGRLLDEAEDMAEFMTDKVGRRMTLERLATAVAAKDPERAEQAVHSIADSEARRWALCSLATVMAASDPDRAEQVARSISGDYGVGARAAALTGVAGTVALSDADFAERVARSITDVSRRMEGLAGVATVLADKDSQRAEQIALSITDGRQRATALAAVVRAL